VNDFPARMTGQELLSPFLLLVVPTARARNPAATYRCEGTTTGFGQFRECGVRQEDARQFGEAKIDSCLIVPKADVARLRRGAVLKRINASQE
jgi:hypothetical protein